MPEALTVRSNAMTKQVEEDRVVRAFICTFIIFPRDGTSHNHNKTDREEKVEQDAGTIASSSNDNNDVKVNGRNETVP